MQYSPKLKKVIAEIHAIIKKNDLAGFVCLTEPGFSEYLSIIDPSFSAVKFHGNGFRLRTNDLKLSPREKNKLLENTSNTMSLLCTTVMKQGLMLSEISTQIDKVLNAKHTDGSHTSQIELDN